MRPSLSESKARRRRRRATVTKKQSSNDLEQQVAANRRAARIRARARNVWRPVASAASGLGTLLWTDGGAS